MNLIAYGQAKLVDTNEDVMYQNEFELYRLPERVEENICRAKNTALAYIEYIVAITPMYDEFSDLIKGENYQHLKDLMTFMRENLKIGLKLKLKKEQ